MPASRSEYHHIKHQLEAENIPGESPGDPPRSYHSLPPAEQARLEKKRLAGEHFSDQVRPCIMDTLRPANSVLISNYRVVLIFQTSLCTNGYFRTFTKFLDYVGALKRPH